ncbi:MAG: hypothetical protein WAT39_01280 [Planctomycetota bacterium]
MTTTDEIDSAKLRRHHVAPVPDNWPEILGRTALRCRLPVGLTEEETAHGYGLCMHAVEAVALGVVAGLAFCAFVGIGFPGWLS